VLWSAIRFFFYLIVPNVRSADGAGASANDPLALLGILGWPISSYWFIYALFVFTLLTWLGRKLPAWVQLAVAGIISVLFSAGLVDTHNVGWDRMGEYLIFFIAGVLLSKPIGLAVHRAKLWHVIVLLVGFLAVSVTLAFLPIANRIPGVVLAGQVLALGFGFTAAVRLVTLRALTWVGYVGSRSLQIYLVHVFVIAGLVALVQEVPVLRVLPGRGFIVLFTVATLVVLISLLLSRVLGKSKWLFVSPIRTRPSKSRHRRGSQRSAAQPAKRPVALPAEPLEENPDQQPRGSVSRRSS
jgi:peptidoglycan/LPS O-acetylase OafA/YrhL